MIICWPIADGKGYKCECGARFKGVREDITRQSWRNHFLTQVSIESRRVHQDKT